MSSMPDRHLKWPADRFYWAVIDASNQALRMMQTTNTFAQINVNDLVFRKIFYNLNLILMLVSGGSRPIE